MDRASHKLDGIPNDLTTSDVENKRRFKVESTQDPETEFSSALYMALAKSNELNCSILAELRLLNARFEEMAETHIHETDIEE